MIIRSDITAAILASSIATGEKMTIILNTENIRLLPLLLHLVLMTTIKMDGRMNIIDRNLVRMNIRNLLVLLAVITRSLSLLLLVPLAVITRRMNTARVKVDIRREIGKRSPSLPLLVHPLAAMLRRVKMNIRNLNLLLPVLLAQMDIRVKMVTARVKMNTARVKMNIKRMNIRSLNLLPLARMNITRNLNLLLPVLLAPMITARVKMNTARVKMDTKRTRDTLDPSLLPLNTMTLDQLCQSPRNLTRNPLPLHLPLALKRSLTTKMEVMMNEKPTGNLHLILIRNLLHLLAPMRRRNV